MTSTLKQQGQEQPHCACTSHDTNVSSNVHAEPPPPSQVEDEYHALTTQTATLDFEDPDIDPGLSSKDADDTWSDEEAPSDEVEEDSQPHPAHATATAPADGTQEDQSKPTTDDNKDTTDVTATEDANPKSSQDDETNTPRFQTYIKLHNDMMKAKTALASDTAELTNLYNHASRLAHILLKSHDKHGDLPLVMQAQACLVLGCSDEDDCYERMEEAVVLLKHAMEEGALGLQEGEAMVKTCEVVMGMRERMLAASDDDEESEAEDGEDEGVGDEQGEGDEHEESKDEDADDDDGVGKNDALP